MNTQIRWSVIALAFLAVGCVQAQMAKSMAEVSRIQLYDPVRRTVSNGVFEVELQKLESGNGATNYYASLRVKNVGAEESRFDSADLELFDSEGLSYFSVSKDTDSVSMPITMSDLIAVRSLKPGRMIEGRVLFSTPHDKAKSKSLTLQYGEQTIAIRWNRQKSADDFSNDMDKEKARRKEAQ